MASHTFSHTSVLLWECIEGLNIRDGYTYVDCTTGGGGHSLEIAKRLGDNGRLLCFDQDENAIRAAKERLAPYLDRVTFIHQNFENLDRVLTELGIDNLGGILADLGCSSPQFDDAERGFSYMQDARLDMRMDPSATLDAHTVVNTYSEEALRRLIFEYGEERFAPKIARAIVKARENAPIETTVELSDLIKSVIPAAKRQDGPHPAKRTFQAIRIEVNRELDVIRPIIDAAAKHLAKSGRIAIISFHSLEDRIVKQGYLDHMRGCTCPRDFPICVCNNKPKFELITKKPILPGDTELENNPRSRSAKLRVAQKL